MDSVSKRLFINVVILLMVPLLSMFNGLQGRNMDKLISISKFEQILPLFLYRKLCGNVASISNMPAELFLRDLSKHTDQYKYQICKVC